MQSRSTHSQPFGSSAGHDDGEISVAGTRIVLDSLPGAVAPGIDDRKLHVGRRAMRDVQAALGVAGDGADRSPPAVTASSTQTPPQPIGGPKSLARAERATNRRFDCGFDAS